MSDMTSEIPSRASAIIFVLSVIVDDSKTVASMQKRDQSLQPPAFDYDLHLSESKTCSRVRLFIYEIHMSMVS